MAQRTAIDRSRQPAFNATIQDPATHILLQPCQLYRRLYVLVVTLRRRTYNTCIAINYFRVSIMDQVLTTVRCTCDVRC